MEQEKLSRRDSYYYKKIDPHLKKITRLTRRGYTKQEIAKRIGVDYYTMMKHYKARPELREAFMKGAEGQGERAAVSLFKASQGYHYTEKEITRDERGDIVQTKTKTKWQPPNVGAALRILKMFEEYYGVDERHKEALIRNTNADAELKEIAIDDLNNGKDVAPILGILQGLRTMGGLNNDDPSES